MTMVKTKSNLKSTVAMGALVDSEPKPDGDEHLSNTNNLSDSLKKSGGKESGETIRSSLDGNAALALGGKAKVSKVGVATTKVIKNGVEVSRCAHAKNVNKNVLIRSNTINVHGDAPNHYFLA